MQAYAATIFQLFGAFMALNTVFLATASGQNNYEAAAKLAVLGATSSASRGASPAVTNAFLVSALANKKNEKSGESPRAAAPPAAAAARETKTLGSQSVPIALTEGVATSAEEPLSPSATGESLSNSGPGKIAALIQAESNRATQALKKASQASDSLTDQVIADTQAKLKMDIVTAARVAQKKVNDMVGTPTDRDAPQKKLILLAEKIKSVPKRNLNSVNGRTSAAGETAKITLDDISER